MPFQPDALDADTLRKLAKRLRRAITDHLKVPVATHQSQAILAQAFSFPDWHGALTAVTSTRAVTQPAAEVPLESAGVNPLLLTPTADVLTTLSALFHFGDWDQDLALATWVPLTQTMNTLDWAGPSDAMRHLMQRLVTQDTATLPLLLAWVREWLAQTHTAVAFLNRRPRLRHRTVREEIGFILFHLWKDLDLDSPKHKKSGSPENDVPFIHVKASSGQAIRHARMAMVLALLQASQDDPTLLQIGSEPAFLLAMKKGLTSAAIQKEATENMCQDAMRELDLIAQRQPLAPYGCPKVNHLVLALVQEGWMRDIPSGHLMALYLGRSMKDLPNAINTGTLVTAERLNLWTADSTWSYAEDDTEQLAALNPQQQLALLEGLVQTLDRYLPDPGAPMDHETSGLEQFWQESLNQAATLFDRLDEMDLFMVCQRWQPIPADEVLDHLRAQCRQVDLRLALAFERGSGNHESSLPFRVLYGLEAVRAHLDPSRPTGVRTRMMASTSTSLAGNIFFPSKAGKAEIPALSTPAELSPALDLMDNRVRNKEELLAVWQGIIGQATNATQMTWESRSSDEPVRWRMRDSGSGQLQDHGSLPYSLALALIQALWDTAVPDLKGPLLNTGVVLPTRQIMVSAPPGNDPAEGKRMAKAPDLYLLKGGLIPAHPSGWDLIVTWGIRFGLLNDG